ncbi:capsid protein VP2 [Geoglobus ahangari]
MAGWIQEAIERPGRVRRYLKRVYGNKAFTKDGKIKTEYLRRAKRRAEKAGNTSLVQAINLAMRLKRMGRKKRGRRK